MQCRTCQSKDALTVSIGNGKGDSREVEVDSLRLAWSKVDALEARKVLDGVAV
jgi:hypothetical protein